MGAVSMMIVYGSTNRILTFRGIRGLGSALRRFALSRKRGATVDNLLHRLILFVIIDGIIVSIVYLLKQSSASLGTDDLWPEDLAVKYDGQEAVGRHGYV